MARHGATCMQHIIFLVVFLVSVPFYSLIGILSYSYLHCSTTSHYYEKTYLSELPQRYK